MGCNSCNGGQYMGGASMPITEGVTMPGGVGYDNGAEPAMVTDQEPPLNELPLPPQQGIEGSAPTAPAPEAIPAPTDGARYPAAAPSYGAQAAARAGQPVYTAVRPHNPPRQPVFMRNPAKPHNPQPAAAQSVPAKGGNGLIGPVGYDNQ
jgi:hypothetical protein